MSDYNGWTNYETWNVKLWIDNDQGSYDYWREAARDAREHPVINQFVDSRDDRVRMALSARLKDEFEEQAQDILDTAGLSASMWADLLGAALSEVNWREIAESLLDDIVDEP